MLTATVERLPHAVRAALGRRGIPLDDLARSVPARPSDVVMLTGSYASGEADPTSDLDLLVILTDASPPSLPVGLANHPSTLGESFDQVLNGLVVNIEYVHQDRIQGVSAVLGRADAREGRRPELPNLQPMEVRLLQRVATGVVLQGEAAVAPWRESIDLEGLLAAVCALNLVMAMSLFEDAHAAVDPWLRALMLRAGGESLVLAALNARGVVTYDVKKLWQRAARLGSDPAAPRVLREARLAVFPPDAPGALATLIEHAEDLLDHLPGLPAGPRILRLLEPYRPLWEWSRAVKAAG